MDENVIVASETEQTESTSSSNTIWNEGRVVGYSAYEVYVRQHLLEDPLTEPASEREWLASSLASGASLLVYIPKTAKEVGTNWVHEITLPEGTQLCAANTIVSSLFYGSGKDEDGHNFARYVDSYGDLIDRSVMINSTETLPDSADLNENGWLRKVRSYLHIFDGVVIQPGTWFHNDEGEIDFIPKLKATKEGEDIRPKIRLHIRGPVDDPFWIVLSGFTMRNIASGTTKTTAIGPEYDESGDVYQKTFESAIKSIHPENGDFLGPEMYPWANKIIFTVPSQAITNPLFRSTIDSNTLQINDTPIIDLEHCNPATYYGTNHTSAPYTGTGINELVTLQDGVAILATYQRSRAFAPALYATLYGSYEGDTQPAKLYPLDTTAPRTIKFFHGEADVAEDFEKAIPYNFALIRDKDNYILKQIRWVNGQAQIIPVSDSDVIKSGNQYHMRTLHGTESKLRAVSLTKDDGTLLSQTGGSGTEEHDILNWKILLDALGLDKQIDVLGQGLREFKNLIVDIFEGADIRDVDAQYVVKIRKDGDNYSIYFEEIDIPATVTFETSRHSNKHYVLTATTQDDQGTVYRYKSLALTNTTGDDLPLDGRTANSSATIDATDDKLTWQRLLNALGENKHISIVGPDLIQFRPALTGLVEGNKYVLVKTPSGYSFQTLQEVNIPEFPEYVLESVTCSPTAHSSGKHTSNIILDVFGYVSNNSSFNTFATLTHNRPTSGAWTGSSFGLVQPFTFESSDNLAAWCNICDKMRAAGSLRSTDCKVIFTTGGRPIYNSVGTYSNPSNRPDRRKINAPRSMLSIVAYIQPIYKSGNSYYRCGDTSVVGSSAVSKVYGMLIWADYHQTSGWSYAPSGGSYTGSLVGDDEEPTTWAPTFRSFSI